MLKAVPNKNAGFIILFTSIMIYFYLYFLSIFIVINIFSFSFNYVSYWFSSLLSFVWIGGQFPQDNFLSYGRILTLYYYFLLICISFTFKVIFSRSYNSEKIRPSQPMDDQWPGDQGSRLFSSNRQAVTKDLTSSSNIPQTLI